MNCLRSSDSHSPTRYDSMSNVGPSETSDDLAKVSDDGTVDWGSASSVSIALERGFGGQLNQLQIRESSGNSRQISIDIAAPGSIMQAGTGVYFLKADDGTYALRVSAQAASQLDAVIADIRLAFSSAAQHGQPASSQPGSDQSVFAAKTDEGSAQLYFHYYGGGMLQHQQNMLQDFIRTGTYYAAIVENKADFEGKSVMDVGAGSGILSLFAAQAGAAKVYAVEASNMAEHARRLADQNPGFGSRVEVVQGRLEELKLDTKVDILISEPMGTLLVNERMLETYLYARDHFLKPGGKMFPQLGRIYAAAFSDEALYAELVSKAAFWLQGNFYGVNTSILHAPALTGYFSQVVVDAVDPQVLVSRPVSRLFDFSTISEQELFDITIPLTFTINCACAVHGVACWFDVLFNGTTTQRWLSTAPGQPTTHWFQLRCVLEKAISVQAGEVITGELRLVAHSRQSYDVLLSLTGPPLAPGHPPQTASGKLDLKEPYYRQLNSWAPTSNTPVDAQQAFAPSAV